MQPNILSAPHEEVQRDIDRMRMFYSLDSVTIVQEPTKVKTGDDEVTKATIMIPTIALLDDPTY
jgi:hypothetical protein